MAVKSGTAETTLGGTPRPAADGTAEGLPRWGGEGVVRG
jgi:hypothetical protein